ncbi:MAG: hypothetical protein JXA33_10600 [Anaerolineae bacterium]|nr:hypothetical protein [Anaerolineae bacterium]
MSEINLQADTHHIRVHIPQANIRESVSNLVTYYRETGGVLTVGESEAELRRKSESGGSKFSWAEVKSKIDIAAPFDIDQFNPNLVAATLQYYTDNARKKGAGNFNYILDIREYDRLPSSTHAELEYALYTTLNAPTLILNGTQLDFKLYRLADRTLQAGRLIIVLIIFLLSQVLLPKGTLNALINWSSPTAIGGLLFTLFILSAISLLLGTTLWVLVMRYFLPTSVLKPVLSETSLPRFMIKWLSGVLSTYEKKQNPKA